MDFVANKQGKIEEMLKAIGIGSIADLFHSVPSSLLLSPPHEEGLSEMEGIKKMGDLAKKNRFLEFTSYLGGGAYEHYIPAIVPSSMPAMFAALIILLSSRRS